MLDRKLIVGKSLRSMQPFGGGNVGPAGHIWPAKGSSLALN